jgi:hypothetical protein
VNGGLSSGASAGGGRGKGKDTESERMEVCLIYTNENSITKLTKPYLKKGG